MSVLSHALVALLVLALLTGFVSLPAALVGALFFAVHPVHSEAVANVMGRSELYAARKRAAELDRLTARGD